MNEIQPYQLLVSKIDNFIRVYYKNRIIRGIIYSFALLILFFLIISLLEFFSYFSTGIRAALFFSYILGAMAIISIYILNPLFRLYKIGKRISHEQAAEIISKHFPDISDKLINTLQLGSLSHVSAGNYQIIEAAISQKTKILRNLPFTDAIDKRENLRRIPYAIIPLAVVVFLLISAPTIIKEPTYRISRYNVHFDRPMPFRFVITNSSLEGVKGDDLDLQILIEGNELPSEVFVEYNDKMFRSIRTANNQFLYRFRNLNGNLSFRLKSGDFFSGKYEITVYPKPVIVDYIVRLEYPGYTRRKAEEFYNKGDFTVPIGTSLNWSFNTEATDSVVFRTESNVKMSYASNRNTKYNISVKGLESFKYVILPQNRHTVAKDSLNHQVEIVPDAYPEISVESFTDSSSNRMIYFTGSIKDDYGFDKLEFVSQVKNVNLPDSEVFHNKRSIAIDRSLNNQSFIFSYNFNEIKLNPGDRIEYYFIVWDNDEINGSKATRSRMEAIEMPGMKEREAEISEKYTEIASQMTSIQRKLFDLSREIDLLQKNILQKESISWEDTNKLQELMEEKEKLQQSIDKLKNKNATLNELQQEITNLDPEIIRKQQELQKLFDALMDDEMRKLFDDLQKMMDKMDRAKMQEMLNSLKLDNEDLMKDLDRTLELFKQLEMEKMITETAAKLEKLAENQEELRKLTEDQSSEPGSLDQKQTEIQEAFQDIKSELDKINDKNAELERKYQMIDTEDAENQIENSMNESKKNLQNNKKNAAVPHQKDASKKMKSLANDLMDMMKQMQNEQLGEDIKIIRKLLEDLIDLSFDQERLIHKTTAINRADPRYNEILSDQKIINRNLLIVEDSLNAIAKRQLAIQQFVLKEISQINQNSEQAILMLEERNTGSASSRQQFVMTSVNNLALMLNEAIDQMNQEMMSNSMDGSSCPNPGKGKGKSGKSISSMKDLQQQLNQQLQEMNKSMNNPGESKNQMPGGNSMSEQFARMAAQQESLRRQMQSYVEEIKQSGQKDANAMKAIEEMEQTEKELVNKRLSRETILRQEKILSRMLESEKAELEREREERRESKEARGFEIDPNDSILEFYLKKMRERELLRTIPIQTNSFYRSKINSYFIQIQKE